MATAEFQVTGMSCEHCENAIIAEVTQIIGVTGAEVRAATGRLSVTSNGVVADAATLSSAVLSAVDEAGYSAEPL